VDDLLGAGVFSSVPRNSTSRVVLFVNERMSE